MNNKEVYEYLYQYPTDTLALEVFYEMDVSNFNEDEISERDKCKAFINKHREYGVCPNYFARHPLYKDTKRSKLALETFCLLEYKVDGDRIILTRALDHLNNDMSKQLIDYIISPDGDLILGKKHYWMAEGLTFVYGAGRMIISDDGSVSYIDNHSGHFQPTPESFKNSLKLLSHLKIDHINEWTYIV